LPKVYLRASFRGYLVGKACGQRRAFDKVDGRPATRPRGAYGPRPDRAPAGWTPFRAAARMVGNQWDPTSRPIGRPSPSPGGTKVSAPSRMPPAFASGCA